MGVALAVVIAEDGAAVVVGMADAVKCGERVALHLDNVS
jgi:hypothetical protein